MDIAYITGDPEIMGSTLYFKGPRVPVRRLFD